jgi:hypothetical protein
MVSQWLILLMLFLAAAAIGTAIVFVPLSAMFGRPKRRTASEARGRWQDAKRSLRRRQRRSRD